MINVQDMKTSKFRPSLDKESYIPLVIYSFKDIHKKKMCENIQIHVPYLLFTLMRMKKKTTTR